MNAKQKGFRRYENYLVITMFFLFGIVFMDRMAMVYLFPFIAPELGLNHTQLGMVVAVLAIAWAFSNLFFAMLSDYLGGKKKMLICFVFLFSIATFSSGLIGGFLSLLIVRVIMGIMEGPVIPLVNSAVMAASSPERRGFNMGVVQSASALFGGALVPIIVVAIATSFNWRFAFFFLAIPGILIALILMKYMKEPMMREADGEDSSVRSKLSKSDFKQLFKQRNIVLNIWISFFFMIFFTTMTAFVPLFLIGQANYTEAQTAMYLAVLGIGMFAWNLLAPWISDRIGRRPSMIIFTFISISIPISVALFHDQFVLLLVLTLFMTAGMGYQPLSLAIIPAESVPRPLVATAIAVIVCIGEAVGGSIGPVVSGILADRYGLYFPLWIVAIACALAFFISWGIKETAPVKLAKMQNMNVAIQKVEQSI